MPQETLKELIDLVHGATFFNASNNSIMILKMNKCNIPCLYFEHSKNKLDFFREATEEDIRKVAIAKCNGNMVQLNV